MNTLWPLIKDISTFSPKRLLSNILHMILTSLTSGIGVLLLVPMLAITGITGDRTVSVPFLRHALSWLYHFDSSMQLLVVLLLYIVLIVFQAIVSRRMAILNVQLTQGYARYLREDLFSRILRCDWAYLTGKRLTDITNAFVIEVNRVSSATVFLLRICSQVLLAVVQLYIAFLASPLLTAFVLICGALMFLLMNSNLMKSRRLGGLTHGLNRALMGRITEQLGSIKESKIYGVEKEQEERFRILTADIEQNATDVTRLQTRPDFFYKTAAALVISFLFYFAVNLLQVEPASMLIVIFIFARLWPGFSSLQNNLLNVFAIMPAYQSLQQLRHELSIQTEPVVRGNADQPTGRLRLENSIEFEGVNFTYRHDEESFALRDISISIPAHSITALVGKSGAGKSTLVDLLLGLLKPDTGRILVDNTVIEGSILSDWRKVISYVPQDPFLFNDTIRENLLCFNPGASEEELWDALEMAAARDFVSKLPQGLDTLLGDRGVRLSGGEQQRIVLARALIRTPQLLVLDEATSALDVENEFKIQQAIEGMKDRLTIIIIAHRMETINRADRIIVIDEGKIIESGHLKELLKSDQSKFRKIVDINREMLN